MKLNDQNSRFILIALTITGFLLRLKAALSLDVLADDMLYASQSGGIISSGILSTHSNPPLSFYLTDLAYNIFGYTTFASRFWPLVAGTLLIPLVFLISDQLFRNKKIALISAFFVTFSTFLIRMTFTEQSILVLFLVFSSIFFFMKYIAIGKTHWLYLCAAGFGLGTLTKYSTPFFFIAFGLFIGYLYEKNDSNIRKKINLKKIAISLSIILFFCLPFILFNMFIYKQNGIVDVYFSRIISIDKADQLYGNLAGQGDSFFGRMLKLETYSQYKLPFITDPIIAIMALFGLFFIYKRKELNSFYFILLMLIIPFILQSAGSGLQKHFAFIPFILSIPASIGFIEIISKLKSQNQKYVFSLLIFAIMLISLGTTYGTPAGLIHKSATSELKSFLNEKIDENNLIILDSRIYSARSFWLASPNSFLLSNQFPEIYNLTLGIPKEALQPIEVFYVECAIDDCGWGWVQNDQNLNKTNEEISSVFASNGILVKTINDYPRSNQEFFNKNEEQTIYKVYHLTLNLPKELLTESKKIESFYFTPYLYKNMAGYIYNYETKGILRLINSLGRWIIYFAMILFIVIIIVFSRIFYKSSK